MVERIKRIFGAKDEYEKLEKKWVSAKEREIEEKNDLREAERRALARGGKSKGSFIKTVFLIGILGSVAVFGYWLLASGPYAATVWKNFNDLTGPMVGNIKLQYNSFMATWKCLINPGSEICYAPSAPAATPLGVEIKDAKTEGATIPVNAHVALFATVKNEGALAASNARVSMFGDQSKCIAAGCEVPKGVECDDGTVSGNGCTYATLEPSEFKYVTATFQIEKCLRAGDYYNFNITATYGYGSNASLPVTVMSNVEYVANVEKGAQFTRQVKSAASTAPVVLSMTMGLDGQQPVKAGGRVPLLVYITNFGSGAFRLSEAQITLPENFMLEQCSAYGQSVTAQQNTLRVAVASDSTLNNRWFKSNDYVIVRCQVNVPLVSQPTQTYNALASASYDYANSKTVTAQIDYQSANAFKNDKDCNK